MTQTVTPSSDALAALEARAAAGETVTPADYAAALAAVQVEEIAERGRQSRAAEKAAVEAEQAREQAKKDAAALLDEVSIERVFAEYDGAQQALHDLVTTIEARNLAIREAGEILQRAGVPAPEWGTSPRNFPDEIAIEYYVYAAHGTVDHVVAGGKRHVYEIPGKWVRTLVDRVATARNDLPIPYTKSVSQLIRAGSTDVPYALEEHLAA